MRLQNKTGVVLLWHCVIIALNSDFVGLRYR